MGEQEVKIMDGGGKERKKRKAAPTLPNLAKREQKEKEFPSLL